MANDGKDELRAPLEKLKEYAIPFMEAREKIPSGFKFENEIKKNKKRIMKVLDASEEDWEDWKWQIDSRIKDVDTLAKIVNLTEEQKNAIRKVENKYRWAVSPYYASLMSVDDQSCPIRLQAIPAAEELEESGVPDFTAEEYSSPVSAAVRWYPDRMIIYGTNQCGMFCRHCLRRRLIGDTDKITSKEKLEEALDYIRENEEIRDVLLTGGDPLTMPNRTLDWLLSELDDIDHLEIKRIGTRAPCTWPQRITEDLIEVLEKYHPLYINTQFNHPKEVTAESAEACDMLSRAGIPLGNQTVLLKGVNDDPNIIKLLNHELLKIRVRPYYIYHCEGTVGITHFRTPVEKGIEILENLRGYTSGMAVPDYIISAPGSLGKTPLAPQYQISAGNDYLILRNWEGRKFKYENRRCKKDS